MPSPPFLAQAGRLLASCFPGVLSCVLETGGAGRGGAAAVRSGPCARALCDSCHLNKLSPAAQMVSFDMKRVCKEGRPSPRFLMTWNVSREGSVQKKKKKMGEGREREGEQQVSALQGRLRPRCPSVPAAAGGGLRCPSVCAASRIVFRTRGQTITTKGREEPGEGSVFVGPTPRAC